MDNQNKFPIIETSIAHKYKNSEEQPDECYFWGLDLRDQITYIEKIICVWQPQLAFIDNTAAISELANVMRKIDHLSVSSADEIFASDIIYQFSIRAFVLPKMIEKLDRLVDRNNLTGCYLMYSIVISDILDELDICHNFRLSYLLIDQKWYARYIYVSADTLLKGEPISYSIGLPHVDLELVQEVPPHSIRIADIMKDLSDEQNIELFLSEAERMPTSQIKKRYLERASKEWLALYNALRKIMMKKCDEIKNEVRATQTQDTQHY